MKTKVDTSNYLFSNKALKHLIIPLIIEQFLAVLVGMADSVMIASVGESAVSGVSLVDNIMVLLINIFAALATGGAVVAGQYLGRKKKEHGCKAANQLVWFVTICSLVITAIVYLLRSVILHTVFGQIDADVMGHANIYLLIVAASIPFIALYNSGAAIFRAMGNSKVPMKVSILMNLINVSGNAILIFGFHRGTEGVAIPTLVSRMVAALLIIGLLCSKKQDLYVEKQLRFKPDFKMIKRILNIGVPNGLENSMFQLGKIMVLSLVSTFGTYAIAANAVAGAVGMFQILPGMAISLAITTVVAQCIGAGEMEQAKYYTKKLLKFSYICMIITVALIILLLPAIMRLYNLSDVTAAETKKILIFHGFFVATVWPIAFNLPNTFRAAGDVKYSMWASIFSMWVFRIICSYIIGKYLGIGVFGVWIAMIIDWFFRAILFLHRYRTGKWMEKRVV